MTEVPATRLHRLQGAYNLRDLGGLPTEDGGTTRPGRVFRSDSLQSVTPEDVALLHDRLGIRSLVDLRGEDEVVAEGKGLLADRDVRYVNLPLVQEDGTLVSYLEDARTVDLVPRYLSYLDSPGRAMLRALELISGAEEAPTRLLLRRRQGPHGCPDGAGPPARRRHTGGRRRRLPAQRGERGCHPP
jgi:protein-tyrosine phosphatase